MPSQRKQAEWLQRVAALGDAVRDVAQECPDCWDQDLQACPACSAVWELGQALRRYARAVATHNLAARVALLPDAPEVAAR